MTLAVSLKIIVMLDPVGSIIHLFLSEVRLDINCIAYTYGDSTDYFTYIPTQNFPNLHPLQ